MQVQTKLCINFSKVDRVHFPAVNECSPNPCAAPKPRTKICLFPYYQHEQTNSYRHQKLLHFFHLFRLHVEKIHVYQIQFHTQNICICQCHCFLLI